MNPRDEEVLNESAKTLTPADKISQDRRLTKSRSIPIQKAALSHWNREIMGKQRPPQDQQSPFTDEQDFEALMASENFTASAPPSKGRLLWAAFRVLTISLTLVVLAGSVSLYLWLRELGVFSLDAGRIALITQIRSPDNTIVYDRDGKTIGEFFSSYHVYIPFEKLPSHLVDAIVAIEDREFWKHPGYDSRAIVRAVVARVKGQNTQQGASTITQQVVRHFLLTNERTMTRKVQEIALAIQLERTLSKKKIFEIYANTFFLGNGSYGVGAASLRYFGKPLASLRPHETALIAGLFQSPSRYNPTRFPARAKKRQLQVIRALVAARMAPPEAARKMLKHPLAYETYQSINGQLAPYFVDYVREQATMLLEGKKANIQGQGLRIYTTLDSGVQRHAEAALERSDYLLERARQRAAPLRGPARERILPEIEAAVLSTNPRTGEILAMVGGRSYQNSQFNRAASALRSPGSAFKPVVYSLALASQWKWSDLMYVAPVSIDTYRPRNPSEDFLTETTLLRAFYRSMNTPTIELGQKLGLDRVLEYAKRLGIRSPLKNEYGTLLGGSDVTMPDLARMYGTFANEGKLVEQIAITKITGPEGETLYEAAPLERRTTQAVSPQVAFLMTQGMRNVLAMGTGFRSAELSEVAAGKTGTANESTDNWFSGYTPDLVTIVWVGTDGHHALYGDVTGASLALPIWDDFMSGEIKLRTPPRFAVPPDIVSERVHPLYGHVSNSGVRMYFLRGQEPPVAPSPLEALSQNMQGSYRNVFAP